MIYDFPTELRRIAELKGTSAINADICREAANYIETMHRLDALKGKIHEQNR